MNTVNLNLARKWRSKNFDQIVGQDLSVKILKNSLYLNQFFPVYLFAGQRGCGKTSMARIFAAAVNCAVLPEFQKNPKQFTVPCLTCESCVAIASGRHPDFIEIDAASYTGVDNVRQIVDAASLLPVMGRKKIYLIDEAHMLSKAAFNAFLKILEEPPMGVLFILATTDSQKIIETVRSRCFQLFFKPIEQDKIVQHLKQVCIAENIRYDEQGLNLIIDQAEGSMRDALNILEQVRFSTGVISASTVRNTLGHIDDEFLLQAMKLMFEGNAPELISFLNEKKFNRYSPMIIFKRLVELFRIGMWIKQGVTLTDAVITNAVFKQLIKKVSWQQWYDCLELFYANEMLLVKTGSQHIFLEMILLQVCQKNSRNNNSGSAPLAQQAAVEAVAEDTVTDEDDDVDEDEDDAPSDEEDANPVGQWQQFLSSVATLNDPLLHSIFKQGEVIQLKEGALEVTFPKELVFFQEWLSDTKVQWFAHLQHCYKEIKDFKPIFNGKTVAIKQPIVPAPKAVAVPQEKNGIPAAAPKSVPSRFAPSAFANRKKPALPIGDTIDVSNADTWRKSALLLAYFPGTITEIKERV